MPNPNHHLWNNHGTWFLHCTIYPTPLTKERIRQSLATPCIETARARRDEILGAFQAAGQIDLRRGALRTLPPRSAVEAA